MRVRGRKRQFAFRWLRRGIAFWAIVLVLFSFLWWRGTLPNWIQSAVTQGYIHEIQPHLPFQIESFVIERGLGTLLSGFWSGKVTQVTAVLKWGDFRIRLAGPISVVRNKKMGVTTVDFSPQGTIEPVNGPLENGDRSDPFHLDLRLAVSTTFTDLKQLSFQASAHEWTWKYFKLETHKPSFSVSWDGALAKLMVQASSAKFEKNNQFGEAKDFQIQIHSPFEVSPLKLGPEIDLTINFKGGELLLGEIYIDIPANLFPVRAKFEVDPKSAAIPRIAEIQWGQNKNKLDIRLEDLKDGFRNVFTKWNISSTGIQSLATQLVTSLAQAGGPLGSLAALSNWDFGPGQMETHGKATFKISEKFESPTLLETQFRLKAKNLRIKPKGVPLALNDIYFDAEGSSGAGLKVELSMGSIRYKRLRGELKNVTINAKPRRPFPSGEYLIDIDQGHEISLNIDSLPIHVSGPQGTLMLPLSKGQKLKFDLKTAVSTEPVLSQKLGPKLCLLPAHIPPMTARLDFKTIQFTENSVDLVGNVTAELFGGKAVLDEIGFFELNSEAPETDFNFNLDGLRLDLLGNWLGFGEMDGAMNLHFRDVTFQSLLPTHYDFSFDLKPLHKGDIVFSPTAMKNVIKIFARGDIDALPFYAQFFGFGPIRELLGGYDIDYGGISIFSSDGLIMIETHDPPEIVKKEKKHFVLYGSNFIGSKFTMPLDTKDYPFIVDATAMNNYIAGRYRELKSLAEDRAKNGPQPKKEIVDVFDLSDPLCRE